jgi:hypothetical protein
MVALIRALEVGRIVKFKVTIESQPDELINVSK